MSTSFDYETKKESTLHVEDNKAANANTEIANEMNEEEKAMTLWQGLRMYPKAICWSVIVSSSLIMEGYDLSILGSFYALPAFVKKFGIYSNGSLQIPSRWQIGLTMCVNCGEIIGLQFAGYFADKFGYRKTLSTAMTAIIGFIFILFFAPSLAVLAVGEILLGVSFGCFQTMAVNYASDVCPLALRYYLTTYINICWCIGQLIAAGVLRGMSSNTTSLAYKVPYAVQWVWPVPILIGIFFAPESPWWLVKKGRYAQAKRSVERLLSKTENETKPVSEQADDMVEYMKATTELEIAQKKTEAAETSYWDCFEGIDLRRTEITVIAWLMQNECGNTLMFQSTYFYEQAGLSTTNAFNLTIVQYALGIIGCICSWFLMKYSGRFPMFFYGLCTLGTLMFIVGCLGIVSKSNKAAQWAIGSFLVIFVFIYDLTIGPVCYSIVSEVASTRLRIKTVIISRNVYNIGGIFNAVVTPYMLNPQDWNWGAKTGFFWAGSCILGAIWAWFRLPETKGRTFAELTDLFENRVNARKFKSTVVKPFEEESDVIAN